MHTLPAKMLRLSSGWGLFFRLKRSWSKASLWAGSLCSWMVHTSKGISSWKTNLGTFSLLSFDIFAIQIFHYKYFYCKPYYLFKDTWCTRNVQKNQCKLIWYISSSTTNRFSKIMSMHLEYHDSSEVLAHQNYADVPK